MTFFENLDKGRYSHTSMLSGYLAGIAYKVIGKYYRKVGKESTVGEGESDPDSNEVDANTILQTILHSDVNLTSQEINVYVRQVVAEWHRQMTPNEELPNDQIAERLGVSYQIVANRKTNALKKLKALGNTGRSNRDVKD
jgi:DNA-directed RNA polymerase specialized sigma24 family protein